MIEIRNFQPRRYQELILNSIQYKNTLVILPTGLGKTKVAILAGVKRLNEFAESKVLFLTPTKPLADQIAKEFRNSTNLEDDSVVLLTGMIPPEKRKVLWKKADVIVSTPQGCFNDILSKKISLSKVCLLVIDEAHRAKGSYDYVNVVRHYLEQAENPRIVGLTASPGSDYQKVLEICNNLNIEEIEARTHEDDDVKEYVQDRKIDLIKVELPEEIKAVRMHLEKSLHDKLASLKTWGLIGSSQKNVSKKQLLDLQKSIHGSLSSGEKNVRLWQGASLTAEAIKIQYAIGILETHGVSAVKKYMHDIFESSKNITTKAIKSLAKDINFNQAYKELEKLTSDKIDHPKLAELEKILKNELAVNDKLKVIIFTQYRDSASVIKDKLSSFGIKSKLFVGQAKKSGTGLSQKEQIEILNEFRENKFNALVATNIGEEGLDIVSVDLVIFYEAVPSAIRLIQRKGRTARQSAGKVIMLVTAKTSDEAYHWLSYRKEKQMYNVLANIKERLRNLKQKKLI